MVQSPAHPKGQPGALLAARVRAVAIGLLVLGVVCIGATHGPLIGYKTYANVDEAYAVALASRLLDGFKLYQGAISQRGPLMYYAFELIAWLHGWDNIVALRLWALGLVLAHFVLIYATAKTMLPRTGALVATFVAAYGFVFGFPPFDGIALHGETLQMPALLGSVLLGALAIKAGPGTMPRRWRLLAAGALFGVALMVKQSVVLHLFPLVLWLFVDARRRNASKTLPGDLAFLTLGAAAAPVACLAHAYRQGTLGDLYYYCVYYNQKYHLRPTRKVFPVLTNLFFRVGEQTGWFFVMAVLVAALGPRLLRKLRAALGSKSIAPLLRGFGGQSYLHLHTAIGVIAAAGMFRFFPHYFLQPFPFLVLSFAAVATRLLTARRTRWLVPLFAALGAMLLFFATLGTVFGERVDGRVAHDKTSIIVGKYIQATTKPEDRVFVWGFSPMIYGYSHRRPAGRYVFSTYVTGFVPWFWDSLEKEASRAVPGSMDALLADLDREAPPVVVDAGSVMLARPMRTYEPTNAWLHKNYCFEVRIGGFDIYRRKEAPTSRCAFEAFPFPYQVITWHGAGMPIPLPLTKDNATSVRLPRAAYEKAVWFPQQPKPPAAGLAAIRDARVEKEEADAIQDGFYVPTYDPEHPE